jgi:hypothetical protein
MILMPISNKMCQELSRQIKSPSNRESKVFVMFSLITRCIVELLCSMQEIYHAA